MLGIPVLGFSEHAYDPSVKFVASIQLILALGSWLIFFQTIRVLRIWSPGHAQPPIRQSFAR